MEIGAPPNVMSYVNGNLRELSAAIGKMDREEALSFTTEYLQQVIETHSRRFTVEETAPNKGQRLVASRREEVAQISTTSAMELREEWRSRYLAARERKDRKGGFTSLCVLCVLLRLRINSLQHLSDSSHSMGRGSFAALRMTIRSGCMA